MATRFFSNIMQVSFHGSDNDSAGPGGIGIRQKRFEDVHGSVHGSGAEKYFRNKHITGLESFPHYFHTCQQSTVENFFWISPLVQGFLGQFFDFNFITCDQLLGHFFIQLVHD